MILIYRRFNDPAGDGERAELTRYESAEVADVAFTRFCDDKDVFEMEMFNAFRIRSLAQPTANYLPSSAEILSVSPLEDVDDLENKENV